MKRIPLWAKLYVLALVLRLIPVLALYDLGIGLDDMFQYDMLGRSLAAGNGFRWYAEEDLGIMRQFLPVELLTPGDYDPVRGIETSFRAPGYPAFLALVYAVVGTGATRFFWARLVQAFIGAALAPLTYALARLVYPESARVARWAGTALAVYPMLLLYPIGLGTENLFIPLLLAAVVTLLWADRTGDWREITLSGVLFGFAMLTRSVIALAMPLVGLWLWRQRGLRSALLLAGVTALVVAPWVARNTLLYGKFTFIESSMGYNLHMGYHPKTTGTFTFGPSLELLPYLDDAERDAEGMRLARQFIATQPERFWPLAAMRLGHFFGLEKRILMYFYSNNFFGPIPLPGLVALFLLFTLPFVVLSVSSALAVTRARRNPAAWLMLSVLVGYLLPHVFILAEPRFHLAIVPLLATFAAQTWEGGRAALATAPRARLALAGLLVAVLFFNWGFELNRDRARLQAVFGPEGNRAHLDY